MGNNQIQPGMPKLAEMKLVNYARNNLAQSKDVDINDPVLKRFRFTKVRFLSEVTNYKCKKEGAAKKLENELNYWSLPETATKSILDQIEFVTEEFKTLQDCQVTDKKGVLYKIFYSMVEHNEIIWVAMMVNVVEFDGHIVEGVEEVKKPIYENSTTVDCSNFLGLDTKFTREKKKIIGHKIMKLPKIRGMKHEEIESCMKYLEFQTCKKLLWVSNVAKGVEEIETIELEQERIGKMSDKNEILRYSDPAPWEEPKSDPFSDPVVMMLVIGAVFKIPIIVFGSKLSI